MKGRVPKPPGLFVIHGSEILPRKCALRSVAFWIAIADVRLPTGMPVIGGGGSMTPEHQFQDTQKSEEGTDTARERS